MAWEVLSRRQRKETGLGGAGGEKWDSHCASPTRLPHPGAVRGPEIIN